MCLTLRKQYFKMIFRLVIPFANRLGNLGLADWPANLQIGLIGRLDGTNIPVNLEMCIVAVVADLCSRYFLFSSAQLVTSIQ